MCEHWRARYPPSSPCKTVTPRWSTTELAKRGCRRQTEGTTTTFPDLSNKKSTNAYFTRRSWGRSQSIKKESWWGWRKNGRWQRSKGNMNEKFTCFAASYTKLRRGTTLLMMRRLLVLEDPPSRDPSMLPWPFPASSWPEMVTKATSITSSTYAQEQTADPGRSSGDSGNFECCMLPCLKLMDLWYQPSNFLPDGSGATSRPMSLRRDGYYCSDTSIPSSSHVASWKNARCTKTPLGMHWSNSPVSSNSVLQTWTHDTLAVKEIPAVGWQDTSITYPLSNLWLGEVNILVMHFYYGECNLNLILYWTKLNVENRSTRTPRFFN